MLKPDELAANPASTRLAFGSGKRRDFRKELAIMK